MILARYKSKKHQKYLELLPKISQDPEKFHTLYSPQDFYRCLLQLITQAKKYIYLTALYLEQDRAGQEILTALYQAKRQNPQLDICILVDWHRAQRTRLGEAQGNTNSLWYQKIAAQYPEIDLPIYGVPVNTREALGVLHLKGFLIDDHLLYSSASINEVYLHYADKYRYDRYHLITNVELVSSMLNYIRQHLLSSLVVLPLDKPIFEKKNKQGMRYFRTALRHYQYQPHSHFDNSHLTITPLVGLGKKSILNTTLHHLTLAVEQHLILCTPYFNLPTILLKNIRELLRQGKSVEIIVGDKVANDFYSSPEQPFHIISTLPYLYEINLHRFAKRLQRYIHAGQLIIRLWQDGENSYHVKGLWVDNSWFLLTGHNCNPRAYRFDLENGVLIHDPLGCLQTQREQELRCIRKHTRTIKDYRALPSVKSYPDKVRKILQRLHRMRIDRLINQLL